MPAKSEQQRKLIFTRRSMYKTKAKTPNKWKWIWEKGWENKGSLPEKVSEDISLTSIVHQINEMNLLKEGLEKHFNVFIEDGFPDLINSYHWNDGLIPNDKEAAEKILDALSYTDEFGPTAYDEKTGKIEFSVHKQFLKNKK